MKFLRLTVAAVACFASVTLSFGQQDIGLNLADHYDKREVRIEMRDGTKLHTSIFIPKDQSTAYPIMLNRTPYSCRPYGPDAFPSRIGPSSFMEQERYIFVKQDVRGRWNSEGTYDNMRPHVPGDSEIDESSDTYDTIEWLINNVPNNNGRVGMWGISYPGFYAAAALPEHHPALQAVSPQAPIADFFFDDFHHQGAYLLSYFIATATFGYQHSGPTTQPWYRSPTPISRDAWTFYTDLGALSNADKYYGEDNFFWQQLVEHPNYDEFWQQRSILPHLNDVNCAVMTVGGWFDAEDLYGPLHIYRELEKNNPEIFNALVMGPWGHGDWARAAPIQVVGNVPFGRNISIDYQQHIEAPFFRHFLKGQGNRPAFEARVFDTGIREWRVFEQWPPTESESASLFLHSDGRIEMEQPPADNESTFSSFTSDPSDPVPYRNRKDITIRFTPRPYMTDDQSFAGLRDDVLVFQTPILSEPITLVGDLVGRLHVSTDQTDADWIVKLIDVYPDDHPQLEGTPPNVELAGYQQMVRSEVFRGRFRESFVEPKPFEPGKVTQVNVPLQDVMHTFKPGHRIMIHVQSTWFPLIDRNPQKYIDNIFKAEDEDFVKAEHRLYHSAEFPSHVEIKLIPRAAN